MSLRNDSKLPKSQLLQLQFQLNLDHSINEEGRNLRVFTKNKEIDAYYLGSQLASYQSLWK